MPLLFHLGPGLLAISLAALLAGCGSESAGPLQADSAPQPQVVANDCRAPGAQTTQRGCKPVTKTMGSL